MPLKGPFATIEERRQSVAKLIALGYKERQIAAILGISLSAVWSDKQALAREAEKR